MVRCYQRLKLFIQLQNFSSLISIYLFVVVYECSPDEIDAKNIVLCAKSADIWMIDSLVPRQ